MRKAWFWISVLTCVVALAASAALLVDYVRPAPVFCDEGGACGVVKQHAIARPFGVPLPTFAVSGFLAIALFALVRGRRARLVQAALATAGGLFAAFLFFLQWRMRTLCPYCAVVDGSALVLMGVSVARLARGWDPPEGRRIAIVGAAAAVCAIAAPLGVGLVKEPLPPPADDGGVPAVIAEEIARTPKGKVTIVDFADFECPWCRLSHAELAPLLEQHGSRIRLVRRHVPMRMHPHARDAARAAVCAEAMGKGEEVADALFAADPEALTAEGCARVAAAHGLEEAKVRACMDDPATEERIKADGEIFRAARGRGLPLLFIEGRRFVGAQDRATLRQALEAALAAK